MCSTYSNAFSYLALSFPFPKTVLLLPSKLTPFVKDVGGALCINPGTLTKGGGGGTYAMLNIHPLPFDRLEKMAPGTEVRKKGWWEEERLFSLPILTGYCKYVSVLAL